MITYSKAHAGVEKSNILGDCVECKEPALAYTGATLASKGNYLCARCTAAKKAAKKPTPATRAAAAPRRDFPEPPALDGARWLQLGDRRFALVDDADFRRANVKNWFFLCGFAVRREQWGGKLRHRYLHDFVLGLDASPDGAVEFVDKDPLNCRRSNLRVTT